MGRGRLYGIAVAGLLVAAGVVAWRTWAQTSVGPFDPVSAVIALAGLAVSVAAFGLGWRAQREADADVAAVAGRLAVTVGQAETKARRQLLGGHDRTIDVQFSFHPATAHNAAGAGKAGTLKEVVTYYRQLRPRRMVITGTAGSGKTLLAVELILRLLEERAADAPVPVRMSAASLDTGRPAESAIEDWLADHLRQVYGLPEAAARQLVAARMVIPVLDGLDEMDAIEEPGYSSRAGRAIRACNAYLHAGQKGALVLTCRISQYEALEHADEWVHDAARIQLRPVGVPTAREFLTQRVTDVGRWRTVLAQMRRSSGQPLARALATPWRLTLAAAVYDQRDPWTGTYTRDPAELTLPEFDTEDKIRDHLLGLFIPAAMAAFPGRYSSANVHRWLGALSGYLGSNTPSPDRPARVVAGRTLSGSDLVLHELWPLAGSRAPRAASVTVISVICAGLAALMLTHVSIGVTWRQITGALTACVLAILAVSMTWVAWPQVQTVDLRKLRTREGQGWVALGIALGIALGLASGLATAFPFAHLELASRLLVGLTLGLVSGLAVGLADNPDQYSVAEPRQVLRSILQVGIALGLTVGPVFGLALGLAVSPVFGIAVGIGAGLVVGPLGFVWQGFPGLRFIALLLCTRRWNEHWLPWRLGSFLDWCYQAGLIRIAGISYQLRHRELQDYLFHNPVPRSSRLRSEAGAVPAPAVGDRT